MLKHMFKFSIPPKLSTFNLILCYEKRGKKKEEAEKEKNCQRMGISLDVPNRSKVKLQRTLSSQRGNLGKAQQANDIDGSHLIPESNERKRKRKRKRKKERRRTER